MIGNAPAHKEAQRKPGIFVIHHTDAVQAQQIQIINRVHQRRGYHESSIINPVTGSGWFIAYHYFIGKDGTMVQTRPDNDRTQHTGCGLGLEKCVGEEKVNDGSISVVLAGNFEHEQPTSQQLAALKKLTAELDGQHHFRRIITHRQASPTSCPGDNLVNAVQSLLREPKPTAEPTGDVWNLSRYYTPVPGQTSYYRKEGYEADFKVNCSGDCLVTASGYRLKPEDAYKVAACPPELPFGTVLKIDGLGEVVCRDRGGAIKKRRIDIWSGVGDVGLQNIRGSTRGAGPHTLTILKP